MNGDTLRIGNGAGFWGDNLDAPVLLAQLGELDYLTLEYLAELTMSILARMREKDPQAGYATDFVALVGRLLTTLSAHSQLKLVTNAGGMNPPSCAKAVAQILVSGGLGDLPVGVVTGDDISDRLDELQANGCALANLDTGEPLSELAEPIVSANAYLGAAGIVEALAGGARIVITGRVADASLTVGPALHEFGWQWDDWTRLAGASVAGHLIECGAQVTGGLAANWSKLDLAHVGYPIAELARDSSCVITKCEDTTGAVNRQTVVEQLVYEIGDPAHYLTPDVDVDFTTVEVAEAGTDRVSVSGASGRAAPETLKVSLAYRAGYTTTGGLLVWGRDAVLKARESAAMILARVERAGYQLDETLVECIGAGAGVPGLSQPPQDLREVYLRISVRDRRREAVERFTRELAPLVTSGPPGIAGYTSAKSAIRPVFAYWPTLVPRDAVTPRCQVRTAADWAAT